MKIRTSKSDNYFDSLHRIALKRGDFKPLGLPDYKITDRKQVHGKKILNVGCGSSQDSWWLVQENQVYGLDGSKTGVRIAKKHGVKALTYDITKKFPFKDKTFDIVIIKDVLEHMMWPMPLLMECNRVAKTNGKIVVNVPNQYNAVARIKILLGKPITWYWKSRYSNKVNEWENMHVRFWTYKGFLKFLMAAGLKPDKFFFDFGLLAHYSDPDYLYMMVKDRTPRSWRVKLFLNLVYPLYKVIDKIFFPRRLRSFIVSLAPGFLCGHFYCITSKRQDKIK